MAAARNETGPPVPSAAHLHNLRSSNRDGIDVLVPRRRARNVPGLDVHTSLNLTDDDVTEVDGIPCTTLARTHLDLAAGVPQTQSERALNQADVMHVLDLGAIRDQLRRNPGAPGAYQLSVALRLYVPGHSADREPAGGRLRRAVPRPRPARA